MKVIICGAGQVGWQIARHLSGEKNDVTIVDMNADLVRRASETLDVQGVAGFASHPDVLERAGARDADMIIAATHSDEVNMVTCQVAHSVFSVPRKIARLRAQTYLDTLYSDLYRADHMPIDVVISPEKEVAEAALQRLAALSTFDTESFMGGRAQLLGIVLDPDCPVLNTPLRQLSELFASLRAIVVGVRRNARLFAPDAGDQLFAGDRIYGFSHTEDVNGALDIFGKSTRKQERLVIVGAGNAGLGDAEAEMIEAQVLSTLPLAGRLVRDIAFPEGVLVGAVMKGPKVIKPTGDLRIDENDVIALFAMAKDVPEVERAAGGAGDPGAGRTLGLAALTQGGSVYLFGLDCPLLPFHTAPNARAPTPRTTTGTRKQKKGLTRNGWRQAELAGRIPEPCAQGKGSGDDLSDQRGEIAGCDHLV